MDSESLTLRPFRVSDVDDLILWAGDEQVTRTIRWKTITSKEEALTFIKEVCIPHPFCRSICIDDRSIGFVYVIRARFKVSAESGTTRPSRIRLDTCRDETDTRYGIMHELDWESVRLD
ncbi:uncharacterized protein LOC132255117 [Vitis vinifera]|uniref:uncharacterized protein LOC132255117 n=1 Tax=Vitis vinifera TaxID=29760 RepID=UPI0028834840|nr:uncharacterized protein LOC132255117 [Vitis vinifera]